MKVAQNQHWPHHWQSTLEGEFLISEIRSDSVLRGDVYLSLCTHYTTATQTEALLRHSAASLIRESSLQATGDKMATWQLMAPVGQLTFTTVPSSLLHYFFTFPSLCLIFPNVAKIKMLFRCLSMKWWETNTLCVTSETLNRILQKP